jgi:uncharacterized protein (TIGR02117 family)
MGRRRLFGRIAVKAAVCTALLAAACQPPVPVDAPAPSRTAPDETAISLFVASNGWHSAVVLARADIPDGAIPELADFPDAAYIAFGWGDAAYFPARDPSILTALSAGLLPTPSVLHISGLAHHPRAAYPNDEVVGLKTSPAGLRRLIGYLGETVERNGADRARASAPGLDPRSLFYRARGSFHLFNTCNIWAARALRAAGLPVDASNAVDAESLMGQLRSLSADPEPARSGPSRQNRLSLPRD